MGVQNSWVSVLLAVGSLLNVHAQQRQQKLKACSSASELIKTTSIVNAACCEPGSFDPDHPPTVNGIKRGSTCNLVECSPDCATKFMALWDQCAEPLGLTQEESMVKFHSTCMSTTQSNISDGGRHYKWQCDESINEVHALEQFCVKRKIAPGQSPEQVLENCQRICDKGWGGYCTGFSLKIGPQGSDKAEVCSFYLAPLPYPSGQRDQAMITGAVCHKLLGKT